MSVSAYALCTLAQLKSYLGITSTDYDSQLEDLVDAASAQAEAFTGRKLAARDYPWELDGNGQAALFVPEWPLNSITTLEINGAEIPARTSYDGAGYVIEADQGLIRLSNYVFYLGMKNVEIAANAGYATVPEDLRQAVIELAAWKAKQSSMQGIGQDWLGKTSEAKPHDMGTLGLVKGIPADLAEVLGRYARRGGL